VTSPGQRRGFGTELLEKTLAFELKAKTSIQFDPAGFRCAIELPMSDRLTLGRQG
jgi:two-component system CheB/CheR fusion protein